MTKNPQEEPLSSKKIGISLGPTMPQTFTHVKLITLFCLPLLLGSKRAKINLAYELFSLNLK